MTSGTDENLSHYFAYRDHRLPTGRRHPPLEAAPAHGRQRSPAAHWWALPWWTAA